MKKTFSMLLALLMVLAVIPMATINVSAAELPQYSSSDIDAKFNQLKLLYPHGSGWNRNNGTDEFGASKAGSYKCSCSSFCTYNCSCLCGHYSGAYQCAGFAKILSKRLFGYNCGASQTSYYNITVGDKVNIDSIVPGDIIRYRPQSNSTYDHSIVVIKVVDNTIYYVDCNGGGGGCRINWNRSITKNDLKTKINYKLYDGSVYAYGYVMHYKGNNYTVENILSISYHANGGTIDSTITGHKYEVTENEGLNMRSGAGTSYSLVKSFAKGTTFTVDVGNTKNANGYTWGKTTIDGKTGWVVISDFVSETGVLRNTDYYLNASLVYKTSNASAIADKVSYGVAPPNGLYNASTFKLTRAGYSFVGWSASPDGSTTVFDQDDTTLKAEDICPALKDGNKTIMLYAIWEKDCSENHNYQYSLSTAPTASATGTLTGTCTVCADATTIILPKLSATDYAYSVTKAATCTAAGTGCYTWKTTAYGNYAFDITIAALGHDYQNGICIRCSEKDPDYTVVDPTAPQIVIEKVVARSGNQIKVTVSLKNNPGIWGMDLVLQYDSSQLTLSSVANGTVFASSEWTAGDLSADKYILSYEADGFNNIVSDGVLAVLEFTVSENATVGSFIDVSVAYKPGDIINIDFEDINMAVVSGGVEIIHFVYGDLNNDGLINKKDSLLLKMHLANHAVSIEEQAADVYADGIINKKDSLYLRQYLAGYNINLGK